MDIDPDLQRFIRRWSPPAPSADFDERMYSRFRRARGWRSKWRRFSAARVSVPVPVLTAGLLLVICLFLFSMRRRNGPREHMGGFEPVSLPQITVVRAEVGR
jgi:hypothetical protein